MARFSHLIVDGLAFVLAGIGLTAAVMGQMPKLPASTLQPTVMAAGLVEPVETGSIIPKGKGKGADASKAFGNAEQQADGAIPSSNGASGVWVDPPHRWTSSDHAGPSINLATGLRIP